MKETIKIDNLVCYIDRTIEKYLNIIMGSNEHFTISKYNHYIYALTELKLTLLQIKEQDNEN